MWATTSSSANWKHVLQRGASWAYERIRSFLYSPPQKIQSVLLQRRGSRHLRLDDATIVLLERNGFKTIYAEDYTFPEQVEIFSNAKRVLAPHGAGMSNIVFCAEGTHILEYFPPVYVTPAFWILANTAKLDYSCAVGMKCPEDEQRLLLPHTAHRPVLSDIVASHAVIEDWLEMTNA